MLKLIAASVPLAVATLAVLAPMATVAEAGGKRVRLGNVTPPPTVSNPTTGAITPLTPWRKVEAGTAPGGVIVRTGPNR